MIHQSSASALFAEILQNDRIDLGANLSRGVDLDFTTRQFAHCFSVSSQLWQDQLERAALVHITQTLQRTGEISPADQLLFKHERARYKHLRFAFAVFGSRHSYPPAIDAITSVMGNLQDAFKNQRHGSARRNAVLLRALLHPVPIALATYEVGRFCPTTPRAFRQYLSRQASEIAEFLERDQVTAKSFHDTRKIVSRCRAGFATLKTLCPSPNSASVADFLATINGLMGNLHDDLMSAHLAGTLDYRRDRFDLRDDIRQRLQILVSAMH